MEGSDWFVLGVDPAPSKKTVAFDGKKFHHWQAADVRQELHKLVSAQTTAGQPVLVLWDAPICMDKGSFYGRQVDKDAKAVVKRWMLDQIVGGKVDKEKPAVGIAAAAQCPHNLLSMDVLGLPMGQPKAGLSLLTDPKTLQNGGAWVAEVHPAVAMGAFYARHRKDGEKLLRYKKNKERSLGILNMLLTRIPSVRHAVPDATLECLRGCESEGDFGDDELDAFVAWLLGRLLLRGKAQLWRGFGANERGAGGYYVMPSDGIETVLTSS
jgi:predicted nuclease with RNAse H fold